MYQRNRLGQMILEHWQKHRPQMVEELRTTNQLDQTIYEAQETTGDLLYELVSVRKMDYQAAWEIAMGEWTLLPSPVRWGDGDGRGASPAEPGSPAVFLGGAAEEPLAKPFRDFRITAANGIGEGSLREKAFANLAAIRTLKQIEADDREATGEEKAILARYSGWGAMANVFEAHPPREWEKTAEELRQLLTTDEYASARASTPNAHFTSPLVISAVWEALERLGVEAGTQVLEPSMGVGHFFGLMPEALAPGARKTGV